MIKSKDLSGNGVSDASVGIFDVNGVPIMSAVADIDGIALFVTNEPEVAVRVSKYGYIFPNNLKIIEKGGWHFTNIKTPDELFEKFSNFGHHDEFELANIDVDIIKEKISNKEVFYDHLADKDSPNRWSDSYKLKKIDESYLPKYLVENSEKFKDWID